MQPITLKFAGLPDPAPRVSVIIVTWNKQDYVLRLLDQLAASPYPNWTVRVVDSHSSDGTADAIAARHPWVRILRLTDNLGGSGGFNAGLGAALREDDCDYVWLLDNDVALEPGALEVLVETLAARPDAGVAGSHIIQMDNDRMTNEIGGAVDLERGRLILHHHGTPARFHHREVYEVDYAAACSLLVRFEVLRQVGIWDDFFIHYDDVDWCLRIRAAGYRVLACAASRIRHLSARVKPVTWVLYYDIRNMLYLRRKYMGFRPLRELSFFGLLIYFNMRDELAGKRYYARLVEQAVRDFIGRRMGKAACLPMLKCEPAKTALQRRLHAQPGSILVLEPTRHPVFSENDLAYAVRHQIQVAGVCHENEMSCTALPCGAPRIRLSGNRWIMAAQLIKRLLCHARADYLVLDFDKPCGLLGLCAKRIILIADDQCHESKGCAMRLMATLAWPLRWLPILLGWMAAAPPLARLLAAVRTVLRVLRQAPALIFPRIALRLRLRRWPLLRRMQLAQASLGSATEAAAPCSSRPALATCRPTFRVATAAELQTALRETAVAGGDILITVPRIEMDAVLQLPAGVDLIGAHARATLVFRKTQYGISIRGAPDRPVHDCAIRQLAIAHESAPTGFRAAILIANAHDIVLDRIRIDAACGIGIAATDGALRVALENCTVYGAGQDGLLLLRRVLDVSAISCTFSNNHQSGILLCDWRLPPGVEALDFDAQLRHAAAGIVAFAPEDPGPCRIRLQDCVIAHNRKMGVCTDGAGLLSIVRCRIHDNQCEGVTLDNGTWHAAIDHCAIWGNGRRAQQSETELSIDFVAGSARLADGSSPVKLPAISMDNAAFCRVEACDIRDNHGEGVKLVRAAYWCTIRDNTIAHNNRGRSPGHPHHGVRIGADPAQHPGQHDFPSSANAIINNHISGAHAHGILLNAGTNLNRISGNRIDGTLAAPIHNWSRFANQ